MISNTTKTFFISLSLSPTRNPGLSQPSAVSNGTSVSKNVIDAGHYGLEQVFIDDMKDLIRTHFSDMNVITYKAGSPYKVV